MIRRVPAGQLRPDDLLVPTNRVVVSGPSAGARTPSGKVELTLLRAPTARRPDPEPQQVCFNARTIITVERADA